MGKNRLGSFWKVFVGGTLAGLATLQVATWTGCVNDDEKKWKLTYKVLQSIECVPWQFTEDSEELCLCFGEPKYNSVFAFLAPDSVCFDVDEDGNAIYEDGEFAGTGSLSGTGYDDGTGSMSGTGTGTGGTSETEEGIL